MTQQIGNSNLFDTWAAEGDVEKPATAKINDGWNLGERPAHEYMNWLHNLFGQKLNHVLQHGIPSWTSATTYSPGDFASRSGSAWQAVAQGTNSAPSDSNPNWTRLATMNDVATAQKAGLARKATDDEVDDGSNDDAFITPADLKRIIADVKNSLYPVGSVYENYTDSRNPSTLLGFGSWASLGSGRTTLGVGSGYSAQSSGGQERVTLSRNQMPRHRHLNGVTDDNPTRIFPNGASTSGASGASSGIAEDGSPTYQGFTDYEGGNDSHENMMPYITVYRWRRTA